MPNECEFYFYDRDYCCALLKHSNRRYVVDSDWAHRYCWGYHYDDCPYYRNKSDLVPDSGGCYLTSACVYAKGLPDDCYELETLRRFRDEYMMVIPHGPEDIQRYYTIAPFIVKCINSKENSMRQWNEIYEDLVVPCVGLIEERRFAETYAKYKAYALRLAHKYL